MSANVKKDHQHRAAHGSGTVRPLGPDKWEIRIYINGKQKSETFHGTEKAANKRRREWLTEVEEKRTGSEVPMNDLFDLYLRDQRQKDQSGISINEQRIDKHLRPYFGKRDAYDLEPNDIDIYIEKRLLAGAAPATINRELSAIRRSITLGRKKRIANVILEFENLPEDNVRQGFLEHENYLALRDALPSYQRMLLVFGYYTGVRKGELLKFHWSWLLEEDGETVIKVPGATKKIGRITKTRKPHTIPVYGEMQAWLDMAKLERNPECPYMFQRDGKRMKNIRGGWEAAAEKVGVPELLFHDLRRTAIRNALKAGIREDKIMQMTGHLTHETFERYDLRFEADAVETGQKMADYWKRKNAAKNEGERMATGNLEGFLRDEAIQSGGHLRGGNRVN